MNWARPEDRVRIEPQTAARAALEVGQQCIPLGLRVRAPRVGEPCAAALREDVMVAVLAGGEMRSERVVRAKAAAQAAGALARRVVQALLLACVRCGRISVTQARRML
jgi:hypothetical protein